MKSKDLKEFKNKSAELLKKEIVRLIGEKNEAKMERDVKKAKNVHKILALKKSVAQIMTLVNEKAFEQNSAKVAKTKETENASS